MDLDVHSDLVREAKNIRREGAGLSSYNPDPPDLPSSIDSLRKCVSQFDKSPSELRCRNCEARLTRGEDSVICLYCGNLRYDEVPPAAMNFKSTVSYRWLLETLNLDGSEIVGPSNEDNESMNWSRTPKDVSLSELLDLKLEWPANRSTFKGGFLFREQHLSEHSPANCSKNPDSDVKDGSITTGSSGWRADFRFTGSDSVGEVPSPSRVGTDKNEARMGSSPFEDDSSGLKKEDEGSFDVREDAFDRSSAAETQLADDWDPFKDSSVKEIVPNAVSVIGVESSFSTEAADFDFGSFQVRTATDENKNKNKNTPSVAAEDEREGDGWDDLGRDSFGSFRVSTAVDQSPENMNAGECSHRREYSADDWDMFGGSAGTRNGSLDHGSVDLLGPFLDPVKGNDGVTRRCSSDDWDEFRDSSGGLNVLGLRDPFDGLEGLTVSKAGVTPPPLEPDSSFDWRRWTDDTGGEKEGESLRNHDWGSFKFVNGGELVMHAERGDPDFFEEWDAFQGAATH